MAGKPDDPDGARRDWERAFRSLIWRLQPTDLQAHVDRLMSRLVSAPAAEVYREARAATIQQLVSRRYGGQRPRAVERVRRVLEESIPWPPLPDGADFHCDSGLGGLARWLRAAGYDARFWPQIADDDLLQVTRESMAILLTTDQPLTVRAAIAWGEVPALLVPLESKQMQLKFVVRRLLLPRHPPRCMTCGGALAQVSKERMRERIPPRTYPWCDVYFLCDRCGKLFWRGTHWERVSRTLQAFTS